MPDLPLRDIWIATEVSVGGDNIVLENKGRVCYYAADLKIGRLTGEQMLTIAYGMLGDVRKRNGETLKPRHPKQLACRRFKEYESRLDDRRTRVFVLNGFSGIEMTKIGAIIRKAQDGKH